MSPPSRQAAWALFIVTWSACFLSGVLHGVAPGSDGLTYHDLADVIRLHHRFTLPDQLDGPPYARYEPLHPAFLAACDVLGGRWVYLTLASAFVAGALGLWFLTARIWFGASSSLPFLLWILLLYPERLYIHARLYWPLAHFGVRG